MKKNKFLLIFPVVLLLGFLLINIHSKYALFINISYSLPHKLYVVKKGLLPNKRGDIIAFVPPQNEYGVQKFLKKVAGLPGDKVKEINNTFYVANTEIGIAKEKSLKGKTLEKGPTGIIPEGSFFVFTSHKDSYDSRYKDIGWIDENKVIGVAYPIF